jgi:hypothetical protein
MDQKNLSKAVAYGKLSRISARLPTHGFAWRVARLT